MMMRSLSLDLKAGSWAAAVLLSGSILAWAPAVQAFDTGGTTAKTCPKGQVWSKTQKKCVALKSEGLTDDDLAQGGRALAKAGRYDEAIEVLSAVARSDDPLVLTYLGYSHRKQGQVDLGISYYRKALAVDPDNVDTREYLGEGYAATGRADLARRELAEIEKRCGRTCEEYQALSGVLAGGQLE